MSDTITLKSATTLKHQSNLGEDVDEVPFDAGQTFDVLKAWQDHYLVKDEDGRLFTVSRELVN